MMLFGQGIMNCKSSVLRVVMQSYEFYSLVCSICSCLKKQDIFMTDRDILEQVMTDSRFKDIVAISYSISFVQCR